MMEKKKQLMVDGDKFLVVAVISRAKNGRKIVLQKFVFLDDSNINIIHFSARNDL